MSACLKSSSDYFSRFRHQRTDAKLFKEPKILGWFNRFALIKLSASILNFSAFSVDLDFGEQLLNYY